MSFKLDAKLEADFYDMGLRPYLMNHQIDSVFMRCNSETICEILQKEKDINVIGDNKEINWTLSLKVVRNNYKQIFWETIKNTNTNENGWGLYSEATKIGYSMPIDVKIYDDKRYAYAFEMHVFDNKNILLLKPDEVQYKVGWGETRNWKGKLLYKTKGLLIPLKVFPHKTIQINCRDQIYLNSIKENDEK